MIAGNLYRDISNHFRRHSCKSFFAPFDVRLVKGKQTDAETYTVVQPDICVICDDTKIDERGCVGAPDLVIEIISPSTAKKDLNDKYNLYEENEVKEYWIVLPESNAVDQYFLKDGKYERKDVYVNGQQFNSVTFPDLQIHLEEIF